MQEGGWYFKFKFLTSNSVMVHENEDTFRCTFYSSGNLFYLYQFIFFACWDCIKTNSSLIVSSKIVNPFVYLSKMSPT